MFVAGKLSSVLLGTDAISSNTHHLLPNLLIVYFSFEEMPKNYLHFTEICHWELNVCSIPNIAIFVVLFLKWLCLVWLPGFSVRDLNWLPTGVDELATFMTSGEVTSHAGDVKWTETER